MSKKTKRQRDPFSDWKEWQDHRYDPGHFTGGRIHPLYKAARPNAFGWYFLVLGATLCAPSVLSLIRGESNFRMLLLGVPLLIVGVAMAHPQHAVRRLVARLRGR